MATAKDVESPLEEKFWAAHILEEAPELTTMERQFEVANGKYRLDFALPDKQIGIEIDSWAFHSSKESFIKDRKRLRHLMMLGWTVLQFSGTEVEQAPYGCVREAAAFVNSRSKALAKEASLLHLESAVPQYDQKEWGRDDDSFVLETQWLDASMCRSGCLQGDNDEVLVDDNQMAGPCPSCRDNVLDDEEDEDDVSLCTYCRDEMQDVDSTEGLCQDCETLGNDSRMDAFEGCPFDYDDWMDLCEREWQPR